MSTENFSNARVHEWLTPALESATRAMRTTRLQLNSAALWWFCTQLNADERAEILGEYVKVLALGGKEPSSAEPPRTASSGPGESKESGRKRRRKAAGDG